MLPSLINNFFGPFPLLKNCNTLCSVSQHNKVIIFMTNVTKWYKCSHSQVPALCLLTDDIGFGMSIIKKLHYTCIVWPGLLEN